MLQKIEKCALFQSAETRFPSMEIACPANFFGVFPGMSFYQFKLTIYSRVSGGLESGSNRESMMGGTKFDFSGQTIVVTGGTRGIGKAISRGFASSGGRVYMLGTNQENGLAVESEIQDMGFKARFFSCDVTHSSNVLRTFEHILGDSGRLDVLINNAGGWKNQQSVEDTSEEEWNKIVDLNLKSVFLCAKAAIPTFKRQRSGHIVNITSIGALTTTNHFSSPPYIASKAGVHGLTRVLAAELGEYGLQ